MGKLVSSIGSALTLIDLLLLHETKPNKWTNRTGRRRSNNSTETGHPVSAANAKGQGTTQPVEELEPRSQLAETALRDSRPPLLPVPRNAHVVASLTMITAGDASIFIHGGWPPASVQPATTAASQYELP
jgi:hypothetical protein